MSQTSPLHECQKIQEDSISSPLSKLLEGAQQSLTLASPPPSGAVLIPNPVSSSPSSFTRIKPAPRPATAPPITPPPPGLGASQGAQIPCPAAVAAASQAAFAAATGRPLIRPTPLGGSASGSRPGHSRTGSAPVSPGPSQDNMGVSQPSRPDRMPRRRTYGLEELVFEREVIYENEKGAVTLRQWRVKPEVLEQRRVSDCDSVLEEDHRHGRSKRATHVWDCACGTRRPLNSKSQMADHVRGCSKPKQEPPHPGQCGTTLSSPRGGNPKLPSFHEPSREFSRSETSLHSRSSSSRSSISLSAPPPTPSGMQIPTFFSDPFNYQQRVGGGGIVHQGLGNLEYWHEPMQALLPEYPQFHPYPHYPILPILPLPPLPSTPDQFLEPSRPQLRKTASDPGNTLTGNLTVLGDYPYPQQQTVPKRRGLSWQQQPQFSDSSELSRVFVQEDGLLTQPLGTWGGGEEDIRASRTNSTLSNHSIDVDECSDVGEDYLSGFCPMPVGSQPPSPSGRSLVPRHPDPVFEGSHSPSLSLELPDGWTPGAANQESSFAQPPVGFTFEPADVLALKSKEENGFTITVSPATAPRPS